mmetsp:Transcript_96236/g.281057  ORF Transcript_96236/g.281057 Transcript_96236/m.281057 type:complete len:251 (+) Transcript_96236:57-809(+)
MATFPHVHALQSLLISFADWLNYTVMPSCSFSSITAADLLQSAQRHGVQKGQCTCVPSLGSLKSPAGDWWPVQSLRGRRRPHQGLPTPRLDAQDPKSLEGTHIEDKRLDAMAAEKTRRGPSQLLPSQRSQAAPCTLPSARRPRRREKGRPPTPASTARLQQPKVRSTGAVTQFRAARAWQGVPGARGRRRPPRHQRGVMPPIAGRRFLRTVQGRVPWARSVRGVARHISTSRAACLALRLASSTLSVSFL